MKKNILVFVIFLSAFCNAQETKSFNQNEIKVNALLTVIGIPEFTYERILNEESGAGISISFNTLNYVNKTTFMLTPYYRFYFGKKPAAGIFCRRFWNDKRN